MIDMVNTTNKENCIGCNACVLACPKKCISLQADEEGFLYPKIEKSSCINCGLCDAVCQMNSDNTAVNRVIKKAYAAINLDDNIRINSSSGGVFALFAQKVIENGGIVFGAAFDESFKVVHIGIDNVQDLYKLRGSKYVQSEIGETYLQAKKYLDTGRIVYFSGTPCQIHGLKNFLRKDYDNLITQDFICHGVPSPMVWNKYVKYRTTLAGASVRRIFSRHKKYGWKRYSVSFSFENDTEYLCRLDCDPFMQVFLNNLCLRPSCYCCNCGGDNSVADITLADFWGVENIDSTMFDDKGTSLVIVNSNKGCLTFGNIKSKLKLKEVCLSDAIKYNSSYNTSVKMPKKRQKFMREIAIKDFDTTCKKFNKPSLKVRIKKLIKKILGK